MSSYFDLTPLADMLAHSSMNLNPGQKVPFVRSSYLTCIVNVSPEICISPKCLLAFATVEGSLEGRVMPFLVLGTVGTSGEDVPTHGTFASVFHVLVQVITEIAIFVDVLRRLWWEAFG